MKVLVTGGAGFIGSHVVDALVADGATVLALWDRDKLAEDSGVVPGSGYGGVTLAHNVRSPAEADAVITEARAAGLCTVTLNVPPCPSSGSASWPGRARRRQSSAPHSGHVPACRSIPARRRPRLAR